MDFRQTQRLIELQKTFTDLQEYLSSLHIESDFDGLIITIDGNSNVIQVHIENTDLFKDQTRIEYAIQQAFKK